MDKRHFDIIWDACNKTGCVEFTFEGKRYLLTRYRGSFGVTYLLEEVREASLKQITRHWSKSYFEHLFTLASYY